MGDFEDEEFYEMLLEEVDNLYPDAPFSIACLDTLADLDDIVSDQPVIIIHDDRATRSKYYYGDFPDEDLAGFNNYTRVYSKHGAIRVRDILDALVADPHFHKEPVVFDPHNSLEGFETSSSSKIKLSIVWWSQ